MDRQNAYLKLSKLAWGLRRQESRSGRRHNPAYGQGRVLGLLRERGEVSSRALCGELGIRPQSLNELLSKMEKSGFIARRPSPLDGRVTLVALTENAESVASNPPEGQNRLLDCLSEEEAAFFEACLDKILGAFEAQDEGMPFGINEHFHGKGHKLKTGLARPADPMDFSAIAYLYENYLNISQSDPNESWEKIIAPIAESPNCLMLVYEDEGKVVSTAYCALYGKESASIENLVTDPEFRRRGIASLLVRELEYFAKSKGAEYMTAVVGGKESWAKRFYMKLGFRENGMLSNSMILDL